ncbi:XRE family transcriptional regulator [Natronospirillum operosum]|uniref:XRE family transcriptional regulator n=1 Tax=Natronospirillum operosum TaxID=2759953 RepID=A0A4Z0WD37_9GAMM|nr:helix-turn-helix transcriptional regulator [Natronospirillum operosum]TGG91732.1 XRE family transcriptional regulator [Natronospirillum operosum]
MAERTLARTRSELTDFLLHHRHKLTPADVGLPVTGRRRTPGLRREEVATLAGVGLTWYTWFEQGRDISVSEDFLLNISRALKLDDAECCHLFLLAHRRPPPPEGYQWQEIPPRVQILMDDLAARPAYVINMRWDVIAWNAAADALFDFNSRNQEGRNLLRMLFADPELRRRLPVWREEAPKVLTQFRCDLAMAPDDPALVSLVDELKSVSPDFKRWWSMPAQGSYMQGICNMLDTSGQPQQFEHQVLTVDEHRHLWMVVYFAAEGEPKSPGAE